MFRRDTIAKTLLVLGSALLAFIVFFVARSFIAPFKRVNYRISGDWLFKPDAEIGWVPANNSSTRIYFDKDRYYDMFTDGRGARRNSPAQPAIKAADFVVLGGSYANGFGINNELTFAQLLARKMRLKVANLAMNGYGTVQSVLRLKQNLDLKPRVIVYAMIADHRRRNISPCGPAFGPFCLPAAHVGIAKNNKAALMPPRLSLFSFERYRQFLKEVIFSETWGLKDVVWRMRADFYLLARGSKFQFENSLQRKDQALFWALDELKRVSQQISASVLCVFIPAMSQQAKRPTDITLAQDMQYRRFSYIDLSHSVSAHYQKKSAASLTIARDRFAHPNSAGHSLIARNVENELRAALKL